MTKPSDAPSRAPDLLSRDSRYVLRPWSGTGEPVPIVDAKDCTVTDADPADGRARTSTSTIAADPSSATFGKGPTRPSSSRLWPLSSVKASTLPA